MATPGDHSNARQDGIDDAIAPPRLLQIIEHSRNEIYVIDAATLKFRFANRGARENIGYSANELAEMTPLDIKPDLPREVWDRLIRPLLGGHHRLTQFRTRHLRKDGSDYPVSVQLEYMGDEEPALLIAFIEDLTDRHRSDDSLKQSEALLSSIIDTAPDAIITIDQDATILSFSSSAEKMFQYDAEEVVGKNVSVLMPPPHREAHDGYIQRYLVTGEKRIIGIGRQVVALRKDGTIFPIELAAGEVLQGQYHVFTGFIRDVTSRVEIQNRADSLQRELNHAARLTAMGEMATVLAHEINQPLTAISNYARVVEKVLTGGTGNIDKAIGHNTKIADQAQRAGEIIRRLRAFVRPGEVERKIEDINEVVRDASELAMIGAASKGVAVSYHFAQELPVVAIDRVQIQQVIVNLVRNAVDVLIDCNQREIDIKTAHERPPPKINVQTRGVQNGSIHVSVHDTGSGIAPEVIERLFEPFITTKATGLGIGLSVCRSIVEAHGGKLWGENDPDGGAVFHFTLPAEVGEA